MMTTITSRTEFLFTHLERYKTVSDAKLEEFTQKFYAVTAKKDVGQLDKEFLLDYTQSLANINRKARESDAEVKILKAKIDEPTSAGNTSSKFDDAIDQEIEVKKPQVKEIDLNKLILKPERFNGVKPNPRVWLDSYHRALNANEWSDAIAIRYFQAFLTYEAAS